MAVSYDSNILSASDITADSNHSGVTRFVGFSIRESAGSADVAAVNFRDGSVSGQILWALELAANESAGIVFPGHIDTSSGVYVEVVSGTVSGVLFHFS